MLHQPAIPSCSEGNHHWGFLGDYDYAGKLESQDLATGHHYVLGQHTVSNICLDSISIQVKLN